MGRPRKHDFYIGQQIDDMIIDDFFYNNYHQRVATCHCIKCNNKKNIVESCLVSHKGTTHKACGQFFKTKDSQFYNIWKGLNKRINNKKYRCYHRYGGRGLTSDYSVFIDFYNDMYQSFVQAKEKYGDKISLDRIDNNKGYIRDNLRWTTQTHQVRNSCKMKTFYAIDPNGIIYYSNNQTAFANNHNLSSKQINAVLNGRFKTTQNWKFYYQSSIEIANTNIINELYY